MSKQPFNSGGRVQNTIKNSLIGAISQFIAILLGFVVRTVFIQQLSTDYLGVNGLFTNILTMLSLAEMGLGSAIIFHMYKGIADNDIIKISKLMNFYKKAYRIIALVVAVIGICLIPLINILIDNKTDIENIYVIFLLFLGNSVASYFFAYKRSIFQADQEQRVITIVHTIILILKSIVEILILIIFKAYLLYVAIQITFTLLENVIISIYADRFYPFLKENKNVTLSKSERKVVFENVKSTFIYKLGSVVLNGTDNIIISAVSGVISVGLLSNYNLITSSINKILNMISNSTKGSIGNYLAKESPSNYEKLLFNTSFVFFCMYGLIMCGSVAILNPFINLWLGDGYLLSNKIVIIHCVNLFINGMLIPVWTFRTAMGLFRYGKWRPMVSAVINLIVSIWLGKKIGLLGVLLGTTITRITTNIFYEPYVLYKYGIKTSVWRYYAKLGKYYLISFFCIFLIIVIQNIIKLSGFIAIFIYGFISVFIFSMIIFLLYGRSDEMSYFIKVLFRRKFRYN